MATALGEASDFALRSFTVDEYHRMAEAGLFDEGPQVELLDGLVVTMPPIGKRHWLTHGRIVRYLTRALDGAADVEGQLSLPLGDRSEPQPDIAVLALSAVEDVARRVEPAEIFAMIELSETSLPKDTRVKRKLYAAFEIPDYLVVDLEANALLFYRCPAGGDYPEPRILRHGETFSLSSIPGVALEAGEFLAPVEHATEA